MSSFSATAQTVLRFMSNPALLEPLRKNTQIAEAGPRAATAGGIRASSSARVRTNRNTRSALARLDERHSLRQTKGLNDTGNAIHYGDRCASLDASLLRDRLLRHRTPPENVAGDDQVRRTLIQRQVSLDNASAESGGAWGGRSPPLSGGVDAEGVAGAGHEAVLVLDDLLALLMVIDDDPVRVDACARLLDRGQQPGGEEGHVEVGRGQEVGGVLGVAREVEAEAVPGDDIGVVLEARVGGLPGLDLDVAEADRRGQGERWVCRLPTEALRPGPRPSRRKARAAPVRCGPGGDG